MSDNLTRYCDLMEQWLEIRDDPAVSEKDKDAFLDDLMDTAWDALTEEEIEMVEERSKMIEVAMVFDRLGRVLTFHAPPGRTGGSIPDSRDLWEVLWENRNNLGGVAHTHPWHGSAQPSQTDVTTWRAVEQGLGRPLLWPIVTFTEVRCYVYNSVTKQYCQSGPLTFELEGIEELRRLSKDQPTK